MKERFIVGGADAAGFSWRDVEGPSPEEMTALLGLYDLPAHIPADEPRRPRPILLEDENYTLVTLVGAGAGEDLAEVRCFVGADWLLTLHARPCPDIGDIAHVPEHPADALDVLAKVMVTGLVGVARDLDARVEAVEEGEADDDGSLRRRVGDLRRVVLPQRDVLTRLSGDVGPMTGDERSSRGLRNSAERMAQIGVEAESLREALHDAAADRQNEVIKRLTVVAAILLPLTFITGFFGQNFGWMVDHIDGAMSFVVLGLALPVVMVGVLLLYFRRRDWL